MEDVNKRRRTPFSLSKLESGPQEIDSREIRLHLPFSTNWKKNPTKFEKTRIYFKSDVFAAVAVVDANPVSMVIFTSCAELEQVNRSRF